MVLKGTYISSNPDVTHYIIHVLHSMKCNVMSHSWVTEDGGLKTASFNP